jgi:UDP-N-acetylmuramoyl-tripeptide--D-alanyl-D-alanine ligase
MSEELWSWEALVAASGGMADGAPARPITGVSIDSRTLKPGELFVALKDVRDGHSFVPAAFAAGAAAALVSFAYQRQAGDGALLRVADPLEGLRALARAARSRTSARVIAVTGSVGKTGTKEALRACLSRLGATHAAEKSYNNHWGVPLTLARMPASSAFAVLEIGMNQRGEIAPLARLARPHVAVITAIEPVHIGNLGSLNAIAEEKSDVFLGLEAGGTAIIKRDSAHYAQMRERAAERKAHIISFGLHPEADVRALAVKLETDGSDVMVRACDSVVSYRLGTPGAHIVENSLAVVAVLSALGADLAQALPALAHVRAAPGRGARTVLEVDGGELLLIDESYNANPASMRAALATLANVPRSRWRRRIAVLGDMLELGPRAAELHFGLKEAIDAAGVDLVFACGSNMARLFAVLDPMQQGRWAESSEDLVRPLLDTVRAGDVVMIKGSLGSRMAPLAAALASRYASH